MSFRIIKDDNGQVTYLVNPRNYTLIESATLVVNTNTTFTVPDLGNASAAKLVIFSYTPGVDVYVALNNAASSPSSSSFSQTNSDHLPPGWMLNTGDVINVLTDNPEGASVTVRFSNLTGGFN